MQVKQAKKYLEQRGLYVSLLRFLGHRGRFHGLRSG